MNEWSAAPYNLYATVNTLTKKGCVTMPLPQQNKEYTIDDIYALPDGQDYIDKKGGSCEVDIAPFAVFLNADDKNYVEPDISVICDPDKLTDKGCTGAPDWIIEIVSPGSRRTDYYTKLFKYHTVRVKEYWIVDPEKNRILVYNFASEDTGDYTFSEAVKAGIYNYLDFLMPSCYTTSRCKAHYTQAVTDSLLCTLRQKPRSIGLAADSRR